MKYVKYRNYFWLIIILLIFGIIRASIKYLFDIDLGFALGFISGAIYYDSVKIKE